MRYIPDKYMEEVIHWASLEDHPIKREGLKCQKRIRAKALKAEANKIKPRLVKKIGKCEVCDFNFEPILQIHHIVPISEFGNNQPENIICVCPNCHKMLHYLYSSFLEKKANPFSINLAYTKHVYERLDGILDRYFDMQDEIYDYLQNALS